MDIKGRVDSIMSYLFAVGLTMTIVGLVGMFFGLVLVRDANWFVVLMLFVAGAGTVMYFSTLVGAGELVEWLGPRLYFRIKFGMFPPRSKHDWLAMKLVQKLVTNIIAKLKSIRDGIKDRKVKFETPVLEKSGVLNAEPKPRSIRSALKLGRASLKVASKDDNDLGRQLERADKAVDKAVGIAEYFGFDV